MSSDETDQDAYFKKVVTLPQGKDTLLFRVAQDLFSSFEVDVGTRFLLRSLTEADLEGRKKVLDLGCGYGPLGIALRKSAEDRAVHMVDRDALAVEYSRQNVRLNRLCGVETYGSLGYDGVPARDFDLVLSNVPGKAGRPVITHILCEAQRYLRPEGLVAIVVVSAVAETAAEILRSARARVLLRKQRSGHTVFHYRFDPESAESASDPESSVRGDAYHRDSVEASLLGVGYSLETAYGLPEFDTPGFQTKLLVQGLRSAGAGDVKHAVVFNPGQGHVPVWLSRSFRPERVTLVDRDMLSLRYSAENLVRNGTLRETVSTCFQAGIKLGGHGLLDLVAGVLREAEGHGGMGLTLRQGAEQLAPEGRMVVAASSTGATRLARQLASEGWLRVEKRIKRKGNTALVLKR